MPWISFKDRHPKEGEYEEGNYLITRFPSTTRFSNKEESASSFENWRVWRKANLNICFPEGMGRKCILSFPI